MKLSEFVRQERKRYSLTQQDLAERAGVGLRFVRELEADKPTLRMDKVNDILDLFGHQLGVQPQCEEDNVCDKQKSISTIDSPAF